MDVKTAQQAKKTAQNIVDLIVATNKRGGDEYGVIATAVKTFNTLSDVYKKAMGQGKGLMITEDWQVIEEV